MGPGIFCLRAFKFFGGFRGGDARAWLLHHRSQHRLYTSHGLQRRQKGEHISLSAGGRDGKIQDVSRLIPSSYLIAAPTKSKDVSAPRSRNCRLSSAKPSFCARMENYS